MPKSRQRTFALPDSAVGEVMWAARRTLASLDLRDAGETAGIDYHVLSRIERGERPCRVTELFALAETYGLAPDLLVRAIAGDARARKRLNLEPLAAAT